MVNMEDLLAARTKLQVHEFYSVGIKGDGAAGYYFDMPRPPEEIERICRRLVLWRTLSLCALGWGPPQTDQQTVYVNIEINLSNYKTSNLIDNFRVLVLEGTFSLSIYLVREMDGRMRCLFPKLVSFCSYYIRPSQYDVIGVVIFYEIDTMCFSG